MNWGAGEKVQYLQAHLFPVCTISARGFLGSFLSNNLKTNQLELNTDVHTLRPIARLKEPRDLFALPKDKDHDCSQQTARWPSECQVLEQRVHHIEYIPLTPEPYYQPTGRELQPRPVGEENGVVVFMYNPISAVNYDQPTNRQYDNDTDDTADEYDYDDGAGDNDDEDVDEYGSTSSSNNSRSPSPTELHAKVQNYSITENDETAEDTDFGRIRDAFTNNLSISSTDQMNSIENINSKDNKNKINKNLNKNSKNKQNKIKKINPERSIQFSRSSVGGSKYLMNVHPNIDDLTTTTDLIFESRFESGNLAKVIKITPVYYELFLRSDMYTNRHSQWFYFRVTNTKKDVQFRFSIVNLVKSGSLYNEGMKPLMYSTIDAKESLIGWRRCGDNISYFRNDDTSPPATEEEEDYGYYTLTFNIEFPHDNDVVYFAHSYPYTYSELQDYLLDIQRHPVKSKYCKLRLLCRSLAGNNVYYLTVTAPTEEETMKKKRAIVVSARVHPGETPASWMMKGLMDFITGDSFVAKKLRHKFIFKLIPMLNPDGVIVGNTRSSLTGKDLNRQYRTVIRETYPSIWYTKTMIKRLTDECGVAMYCDMHAHSRKHNVFIYGCENKRAPDKKLTEQVFPLMLHKNVADKFSFESCKFKVQRNKEGTGRIVIWMLGVTNSYTMEASFGGSTRGNRNRTHFSTADYEHMGRAFCETLMDYSDDNPTKVIRLRRRIRKYRKREKRLKILAKIKKLAEEETQEKLRVKIINRLNQEGSNADEPLNIPLSDYSSDEGDTSSTNSSSENEGKSSYREGVYEGPCCQSLKKQNEKQLKILPKRRKIIKASKLTDKFLKAIKRKRSRLYKQQKKLKKLTKKDDKQLINNNNNNNINKLKKMKLKVHTSTHKYHQRSSVSPTRKHERQRSFIELPTTEPEFFAINNYYTSGDDEEYVNDLDDNLENFTTSTTIYRTISSSSSSRYYSAQTQHQSSSSGSGTGGGIITVKIPPELIITGTKSSSDLEQKYVKDTDAKLPNDKSASTFLCELPPITIKRTNSWHNFNKCIPNLRVNNINYDYQETTEDLQVKLSLKKQVWSGTCTEPKNAGETTRPLSWGVPPVITNNNYNNTNSTYKKKNRYTHNIHSQKHQQQIKIDENENLLIACSNKLTAWQQQQTQTILGTDKRPDDKLKPNNIQTSLVNRIKNEMKINVKSDLKKNDLVHDQSEDTLSPYKESVKTKKKNPLAKIAETTQMITNLAKSTKNSHIRKANAGVSTNNGNTGTSGNGQQTQHAHAKLNVSKTKIKPGKFKTSGIVATAAVQPTVKRKSKKKFQQNNYPLHPPPPPFTKTTDTETESSNVKEFVKKVRTKIKRTKRKESI